MPDAWKQGGTGQRSTDREMPPFLPDRLEPGTQNAHSLAGLGAGIRFIHEKTVKAVREKERQLARYFAERVSENKKIRLFGDFESTERGPIIALSLQGFASDEVSNALAQQYGMATRPGLHCAPLLHKALGTEETGLVRFSFSYFNELEEVDSAVLALEEISLIL
jgi:selenocysteine lyase/cysteine desulfurase